MPERSESKIAILVAVIGLAGVLGTAIIANIDKIRNAVYSSEVCPRVDGAWQRSLDGATIVINQSSCDLAGNIKSSGFDNEIRGSLIKVGVILNTP